MESIVVAVGREKRARRQTVGSNGAEERSIAVANTARMVCRMKLAQRMGLIEGRMVCRMKVAQHMGLVEGRMVCKMRLAQHMGLVEGRMVCRMKVAQRMSLVEGRTG
jgi:ribulose kinase